MKVIIILKVYPQVTIQTQIEFCILVMSTVHSAKTHLLIVRNAKVHTLIIGKHVKLDVNIIKTEINVITVMK